jgi:hypothetical protein
MRAGLVRVAQPLSSNTGIAARAATKLPFLKGISLLCFTAEFADLPRRFNAENIRGSDPTRRKKHLMLDFFDECVVSEDSPGNFLGMNLT